MTTCRYRPGEDGSLYWAPAEPTRRTPLDELRERDGQSLFELCAQLAARCQITAIRQQVSQHLAVLEEARLAKLPAA